MGLCFGDETGIVLVKKLSLGQPKWPIFHYSALITQKASHNAPNVKGCPKLLSSIDLGHFLTFWIVANWGVLGMEKKCVIFYLDRLSSYYNCFLSSKSDF